MHTNEETLAFLVHDVARLMRAGFDRRARELGATRQQWRVLLNLARMPEGPTQAELAERLDVEQITLCRMVDRLSEAGLVERRADPRDRRVRRLHLLPPALPLVDKLASLAGELEREALAAFPAAARDELHRSMTLLRDGLRQADADTERNAA